MRGMELNVYKPSSVLRYKASLATSILSKYDLGLKLKKFLSWNLDMSS